MPCQWIAVAFRKAVHQRDLDRLAATEHERRPGIDTRVSRRLAAFGQDEPERRLRAGSLRFGRAS